MVAERLFHGIGKPVVEMATQTKGFLSVVGACFAGILRGPIRWREVMHQAYLIGNQSVPFVTVTLGFLGLITVYQVANQIAQILPDFSMLGAAFLRGLVSEFAPTICGLMIATRVGSGVAAEIGSMLVTEQVDALRMCNTDPIQYLVVPRVIACTVMMIMLAIYSVLVAMLTGMLIGQSGFQINPRTFVNLVLVENGDVITGLIKAACYGTVIPIIAGHAGLTTTGGSEGVGWATTRAVVNTSFAVIVLDFVVSTLSYLVRE
jgi:phospholipid/cholesterol/gamma-HCH transport system permease protein